MPIKLEPHKEFALFLCLFALFAVSFNFSNQVLLHLVVTLGFALLLYWFYNYIATKHKSVWNTVTTALIIFLLLDYGTGTKDLIYPLIAVFLALSQKFFVEYKNSPIVNPTAGSLLITAGLAALIPNFAIPNVSWWGTTFGGELSLALMALWIVFGLYKWHKFPLFFTFLISHALLLMFRGLSAAEIQAIFTSSTLFFLAAILLIDPRTSPTDSRQQFFFGLLAAVSYNILDLYSVPYAALFAVVIANLMVTFLKPFPIEASERIDH